MLSLEDEALDAVLEIDESDISKENGVDFILERLKRLFNKDSIVTKYQVLEAFLTFKGPSYMPIQAYLNEFYKRLFKTKSYGTMMSDDILVYRLLKSASLSSYHEELVKETIPDLQYDIMKDQLKKTFSQASRQIPTKSEDIIMTEEAFMVDEIYHLSFIYTIKMSYLLKMSITRLKTHQTSSQQIKIMTHITPGEIIVITNKS